MSEYAERDIIEQGDYYSRHVSAMTSEDLSRKSDIAAELAHRDIEIDSLRARVAELEVQNSVEPVAWVSNAQETEQLIDGRPRRLWWECKEGVGTPFYTLPPSTGVLDWVECSERLPTVEEADEGGRIWVSSPIGAVWLASFHDARKQGEGWYWKPTGLKRPQPPAEHL